MYKTESLCHILFQISMNVEQIPVTNGPHVPTPMGHLLVNASLVSLVTVPTVKVNNTLTFSNSLMIRLLIFILLLSYIILLPSY